MNPKILFKIFVLTAALGFGGQVFAQDTKTDEPSQPPPQPTVDNKITVLRRLNLTREQIQQIRRINAERKPFMDAAQERLREATNQLDDAIYADTIVEGQFQERLKAVQLAQAEVSKIRFMGEFAIRRVLTPEQLVKFRDLRARFEAEHNFQNPRRERILDRQDQNNLRPLQNNPNLRRVIRPDLQQAPTKATQRPQPQPL